MTGKDSITHDAERGFVEEAELMVIKQRGTGIEEASHIGIRFDEVVLNAGSLPLPWRVARLSIDGLETDPPQRG